MYLMHEGHFGSHELHVVCLYYKSDVTRDREPGAIVTS